jgi:predicted DNA-binding transcriptional regulator AlpA
MRGMTSATIRIDAQTTYTKQAIAEAFGKSERQLERLVKRRKLPRPFYVGRTPFWRGDAVLAWMDRQQAQAQEH